MKIKLDTLRVLERSGIDPIAHYEDVISLRILCVLFEEDEDNILDALYTVPGVGLVSRLTANNFIIYPTAGHDLEAIKLAVRRVLESM